MRYRPKLKYLNDLNIDLKNKKVYTLKTVYGDDVDYDAVYSLETEDGILALIEDVFELGQDVAKAKFREAIGVKSA